MTEFKIQKLLFGLSLGTSQKMKSQIEAEVLRKYPNVQIVCRYRKEGIYQYLKEQEYTLVIMEENLQGGSGYMPRELQQLTDLGNNRIIFLMDRVHSGDDYVKALYGCGISDGLYLDEADPEEVLALVFRARGQESARKYYGIQLLRDAEKANGVVNEEKLGAYLEYIEDAAESGERGEKYRFVSTRLSAEENRILAASISREVAYSLAGNEVFTFYRGDGLKKRFSLKRWRRDGEADRTAAPQEPLPEEHDACMCMETSENLPEGDEGEMLYAMDKLRAASERHTACMEEDGGTEMLAMLAGYLNTVDT